CTLRRVYSGEKSQRDAPASNVSPTFVHNTQSLRCPARSLPRRCSLSPYAGAVSIRFTPASRATANNCVKSRIDGRRGATAYLSPVVRPKATVPRPSSDTRKPVPPSSRYCTSTIPRRGGDRGRRVVADAVAPRTGRRRQLCEHLVAEPRSE